MQATVHRFDPLTRSGSVLTDDGLVLPFGETAFARSTLRHLRSGQRLTVLIDDAGSVTELRLGRIGLPPRRPDAPAQG